MRRVFVLVTAVIVAPLVALGDEEDKSHVAGRYDITGAQVFVEVIDLNGNYLVNRTSLKNNEFLKFKVNQKDVYVQVVEMVNNLLDDDICKVHVSFKKPKTGQAPEASPRASGGDPTD